MRTFRGWWDERDDTALQTQESKIRVLAVWGRARYFSVTEVPHNIEFLRVSGEETFCFFGTWRPEWGSNQRAPNFQAGSFNHWTRAPTLKYLVYYLAMDRAVSRYLIHSSRNSCHENNISWNASPAKGLVTLSNDCLSNSRIYLQQCCDVDLRLFECWLSVCDAGQH